MEDLSSQTSVETREPTALRWLWLPAVIVVVAVGVWITGGVITNDESVAKVLTGVWFAVAGVAVLLLALRNRSAAVPAIAGYVLAAGGLGGFLLYTSTVDRVVDEDVVVAAPEESASTGTDGTNSENDTGSNDQSEDVNILVSKGRFVDGEHPTSGVASVIDTGKGTVVTLTSFETDPGPDLRVYFVPPGTDVGAGEDLGALKGNKGDQQYDVPASVSTGDLERGSVVIWCRAFSVAFGSADLA